MPTALELRSQGWKSFVGVSRQRSPEPELPPDEQRSRDRLLARVRDAAALLRAQFGARRVVLFGSLAHAAWYTSDTDVDLAVGGLDADAYWQAWRLVEQVVGDRSVDLIEIETAAQSLRMSIERHGIEL